MPVPPAQADISEAPGADGKEIPTTPPGFAGLRDHRKSGAGWVMESRHVATRG